MRAFVNRLGKNRTAVYFAVYSALFLLFIIVIYHNFFLQGKSFVWKKDGLQQHTVSLIYYARWMREIFIDFFVNHRLKIPLWDFSIGYGSDILTTFHYYAIGDPLNLFCVFVPVRYMEYFYTFLAFVRLYLCGVSFSCYCFRMKKQGAGVLAGSFAYMFCGFLIYVIQYHSFFANPMIYFPLILIGIERVIHREKPTLFILAVFLSAVSNFYFFYMIVFGAVFYAAIRFFTVLHQRMLKELFTYALRFMGYGLIGASMAGVILIPVVRQFLDSSRLGGKNVFSLVYESSYYKEFIESFMTNKCIGHWSYLGFPAAALFGVFIVFLKKRQHTAFKTAFLIMTAMLCFPFFGSMLNGFSYVANRWCFLYAALVCYMMVLVWEDFFTCGFTVLVKGAVCCAVYTALVFMFRGSVGKNAAANAVISCVFLFASAAVLFLGYRLRKKKGTAKIAPACLCLLTLFQIALNGYVKQDVSEFVDFGLAWEKLSATAPNAARSVITKEDGFCRFETDDFETVNSSAVLGVPGIQYFWSLENAAVSDYLSDMALSQFIVFQYRDLDHRTFPDALASVKYSVFADSDVVPFGFEEIENKVPGYGKKYHIYENRYALPLGFTYDSLLPSKSYEEMTPAARQEALLSGALFTGKDEAEILTQFPAAEPVLTAESVGYSVSCGKNVIQKDAHTFEVNKKNAKMTLSFEGLSDCETYLFLQGADISLPNKDDDRIYIKVSAQEAENEFMYLSPTHIYYAGQHDYLINLGFHKNPQKSITVTFPKKGTWRFENMEVICQPMENYIRRTEALREESMNGEIGTNAVKGRINLSRAKILCLSIPYSSGWSASVDGQKVSPYKVNKMFTGLLLSAGEHTIELKYRTPGLLAGTAVSITGFLLFGITVLAKKRKKHLAGITFVSYTKLE